MKSKSKKKKKQAAKPKEVAIGSSALTEFFENPLFSSRAFEVVLFCVIVGLAFLGGVLFKIAVALGMIGIFFYQVAVN